jgi:hypothetical protein
MYALPACEKPHQSLSALAVSCGPLSHRMNAGVVFALGDQALEYANGVV